jgi:hypothetical protein
MGFHLRALAVSAMIFTGLAAGDLPADTQAKFIKILASSAGSPGRVACTNMTLTMELMKQGVHRDPSAKVAWASSDSEVKSLKNAGKLVICPNKDWLSEGGSIAVVEEGGKPTVYLHMSNIAASGVTLSDTVLKIGKKI